MNLRLNMPLVNFQISLPFIYAVITYRKLKLEQVQYN